MSSNYSLVSNELEAIASLVVFLLLHLMDIVGFGVEFLFPEGVVVLEQLHDQGAVFVVLLGGSLESERSTSLTESMLCRASSKAWSAMERAW